jgi:Anti-sigma-D factor RsdA to sigma factor binding region
MPDSGFALGDQPSLDEFARTDLLLDALATRRPVHLDDPDDGALATLLEDWRDDLRWPPASALVTPDEVVDALHAGLAAKRRSRRGMAAIGSVAAAIMVFSGLGALVVEARPGDTLYGLHAMFFDQPRVSDNQIELSAKAELAKVQQMIDEGQWNQAQSQLAEVSSSVQAMNDGASRNDLMDQVNLLNTRVESRNPSATLPPLASSTPAPSPTQSSVVIAPTQTSSAPPTPSPSSGRHRHHSHTTTAAPDAPN